MAVRKKPPQATSKKTDARASTANQNTRKGRPAAGSAQEALAQQNAASNTVSRVIPP